MTTHTDVPALTPATTMTGIGERMTPPAKLRRRPMMWLLGVALVALGGLTAAWVISTVGNTTQVVALRANVDRGSVIQQSDLISVEISGDPSLRTVPVKAAGSVIGQYAARDLTEGTLLSGDELAAQVIPEKGAALVGVALTSAQLPATPLRSGDRVTIVNTPRAQDDLSQDSPTTTINAAVVSTATIGGSDQTVVDVTVSQAQATQLAVMVATGRVALFVDGVN